MINFDASEKQVSLKYKLRGSGGVGKTFPTVTDELHLYRHTVLFLLTDLHMALTFTKDIYRDEQYRMCCSCH